MGSENSHWQLRVESSHLCWSDYKTIKYVLDIQTENNYISNICYNKYRLHVSATILTIFRLYSTYQVAVQYMWCILGRRDLVYNSSGRNSNLYPFHTDWSLQNTAHSYKPYLGYGLRPQRYHRLDDNTTTIYCLHLMIMYTTHRNIPVTSPSHYVPRPQLIVRTLTGEHYSFSNMSKYCILDFCYLQPVY